MVEGARGHLVKDRPQQAGMRRTIEGAQPVLDLWAVRLSGEWDAYRAFHRQQQHRRRYGDATSVALPVDLQVLAAPEAA